MPELKTFRDLQIKDAGKGEVAAVFSTFNVIDHDGDVTLPGAFTDGQKVRISAYNHASWGGALPVGKGAIRSDGTEAVMDGRFFMDTVAGRDTFQVVKELEDLGEWSYGFDILDSSPGEFEGRQVRFIRKSDVHEVSPVLLGAGIGTRTLVAKGRDLTPEQARHLANDITDALKNGRPYQLADGVQIDPPAKGDMKLLEHIDAVVTDVKTLEERLADVTAMRKEQGKSLGEESRTAATDLADELESACKTLRDVLTTAAGTETHDLGLDVALAIEASRNRL